MARRSALKPRSRNRAGCKAEARINKLKKKGTTCECGNGCKSSTVHMNTFQEMQWSFDRLFEGRSEINCPCKDCKCR